MKIAELHPDEYDLATAIWEASVRATHHFVTEADLDVFRPMVRQAFGEIEHLAALRRDDDCLIGFVGVADGNVEMLFLDPAHRSRGGGKLLLSYACREFAATTVDVNEQNSQAVGFYLHEGFEVVSRSLTDSTGKPYPILRLTRSGTG